MALPYPTKVVLPFDIATAQDMNERHANDVALAAGTGLDDGAVTTAKIDDEAVTASKIDFTTFEYGTTERVVGKWIDGKSVYQKVINFGALPNNTTKNVAHGISSLNWLVSVDAIAKDSATFIPLPLSSTVGLANQVSLTVNASDITIITGMDRTSYTQCYVVLNYTKT